MKDTTRTGDREKERNGRENREGWSEKPATIHVLPGKSINILCHLLSEEIEREEKIIGIDRYANKPRYVNTLSQIKGTLLIQGAQIK